MEDEEHTAAKMKTVKLEDDPAPASANVKKEPNSTASSAAGSKQASRASSMSPDEMKPRSDSASTPDAAQPPKSSTRKTAQKLPQREARLFGHLADVTGDAITTFQLIPDCLYGSRNMGATDSEALDCECKEEMVDGENQACGDDSGCINRATKMECVPGGESSCNSCRNQRFQNKEYARVSVIKTEKKGFGLRANTDLQANDFIFEYIGEVINEATFRRRMLQYDEEGIKHFYFMSLTKTEFVDATKKGNLGRFCNHSCNPNCYVDKWIVGEKLRMGIFAMRPIKSGEELVFNYNVDRYGADPQPCYCGENNCTGYIGGKTQTERATKLPMTIVEALGIDDGDSWDTAVAKKPRRKKPDEDDEEYVNSIQARSLDEDGARKVMAALMQCKEKWIAVKLLERIERCQEQRVIQVVLRMHADSIFKTILNSYIQDNNVVLQVLNVLGKFNRIAKNKIVDSNIDQTIKQLTGSEEQDIATRSQKLLDSWADLPLAYRISRRKDGEPGRATINSFRDERRDAAEREAEAAATKVASPYLNLENAPKGPRSSIPQRNANYFAGPRTRRPVNYNTPLPEGWFTAKDPRGNMYYYNKTGTTTWNRPTKAAENGPPQVSASAKAKQEEQLFQSIIEQISKEHTPRASAVPTPQQVETPVKEPKKERWRSLPIDKQMKIYENTLYHHVKHVMDKYRHKLPKEDLKRFARDVNKKLVASDYKNNRVKDPTAPLGEKEERKVKRYVKEFFDKAVVKYRDHEKRKRAREAGDGTGKANNQSEPGGDSASQTPTHKDESMLVDGPDVDDGGMSDDDASPSPERKRKRVEDDSGESPPVDTPTDTPAVKRVKEDGVVASPPPPPPPPPEAAMDAAMDGVMDGTDEVLTEEQQAFREQEEALMRENEEAQRLEDEAEERKRGEQEAQRQEQQKRNSVAARSNGSGPRSNGAHEAPEGEWTSARQGEGSSPTKDGGPARPGGQGSKREVLSH